MSSCPGFRSHVGPARNIAHVLYCRIAVQREPLRVNVYCRKAIARTALKSMQRGNCSSH